MKQKKYVWHYGPELELILSTLLIFYYLFFGVDIVLVLAMSVRFTEFFYLMRGASAVVDIRLVGA